LPPVSSALGVSEVSVEPQIVGKLDVVARQIREAVRLFFEQRDLIVVHTIIASAHQILFDLGTCLGITSVVKNTTALRDDEVQSFLSTINRPFNFFKHADRDPDPTINVGPLERLTADFIMDAIIMLQEVGGSIPMEAKVYWAWFVSFYSEEFDNLPKDGEIAKFQSLELGKLPFSEIVMFLKFTDAVGDADA
jgi:hypothetical protein